MFFKSDMDDLFGFMEYINNYDYGEISDLHMTVTINGHVFQVEKVIGKGPVGDYRIIDLATG